MVGGRLEPTSLGSSAGVVGWAQSNALQLRARARRQADESLPLVTRPSAASAGLGSSIVPTRTMGPLSLTSLVHPGHGVAKAGINVNVG